MAGPYVPRLVDDELADIAASHPAVLIVGPRACGKTTTARRLSRSALSLDVPSVAAVVAADVDAALRGLEEPILIDEWQLVPGILGAVKRAVDQDSRPGRFILTGSSQADLTTAGWAATGRVIRLPMYGVVGRERYGDVHAESLVDRVLTDGVDAFDAPPPGWDIKSYVDEALLSGWPEALAATSERRRVRWLSSYIDQLVTREVPALGIEKDPARLRRYLGVLAANSAGTPTHKLLYDAAGIGRQAAMGYDTLLESLLVAQRVTSWAGNRMDRLVRLPKRYIVDAGVMATLVGTDAHGAMRDPDVLGRLVDTYVAAQWRAECALSVHGATLFHLRDGNGRQEVDLVIQARNGRLIGIEVKATSTPSLHDARHLATLRDRVGQDFVAGVVVHTGPRPFRLADRIAAVPIGSLWT